MEDIIIYDKLPTKFGFGRVIKIKENKNLYVEFKDENNKEFYKYRKPEDVIFLNYIRLTDRNNNKIYSDFSIVEYDFFIKEQHFNGVGYITYNKNLCCYFISSFSGFKTMIAETEQLSLLIIDTFQENKLKLIA
ncbi:hypothetical protein ACNSOP_09000 [Aliarcobacter lanthieri]|uniref:hypothetical protein n=1 Tax=Aliarcobacter lanthieri TaxID=1355374 RepID=UPI003AB0377A